MIIRSLFSYLMVSITISAFSQNYKFINGNVYQSDGGFERKAFHVIDGVFSFNFSGEADTIIDLSGRYVLPPFADGHHHGINTLVGLDEKIQTFLDDGIFYVRNPNVIKERISGIADYINDAGQLDVVFSNGGLTSSGGHPVRLHEMLAKRGVFSPFTAADMEGIAYHIIDSEEDLQNKWDYIVSRKPDFIKIFLLHSNRHEEMKDNPKYYGRRGLSPKMAKRIVKKAHKSGLKVYAHVESAADFDLGVSIGIDGFMHMPGYSYFLSGNEEDYRLSEKSVKKAANKGIVVNPTLAVTPRMHPADSKKLNGVINLQKANFEVLMKHGVPIIIGSDGISGQNPMRTAMEEAKYLVDNGFLSLQELIKFWSVVTPQDMFPKRKIGEIKEGYEGSFLVFDQNPLESIDYLDQVYLSMKQGVFVNQPE
ncbi:amidohydrolase family protein [Ekhidna sp.]